MRGARRAGLEWRTGKARAASAIAACDARMTRGTTARDASYAGRGRWGGPFANGRTNGARGRASETGAGTPVAVRDARAATVTMGALGTAPPIPEAVQSPGQVHPVWSSWGTRAPVSCPAWDAAVAWWLAAPGMAGVGERVAPWPPCTGHACTIAGSTMTRTNQTAISAASGRRNQCRRVQRMARMYDRCCGTPVDFGLSRRSAFARAQSGRKLHCWTVERSPHMQQGTEIR